MKFLCDQMLGTLAKWLRIYGFDTFFASSQIKDEDLVEIAKNENRTLITRDKELIYSAKRQNIKTIELKTTDLDEQIKQVLNGEVIDKSKFLSRCIICNNTIVTISKEKIKKKVPPRIFENNDEFWYCKKCDKIYWKGTHYDDMLKKIDNLI